MIIRQAEEDDAQQIMALFHIILKEMEVPLLKQSDDKKLCKALERSFETPECRKTLAQIIVADVSGKVAGIAFGYPNENEHKVDSLLCRFFPSVGLQKRDSVYDQDDSELPDEWYLDSLVVSPKYRGCGIGTALLKALPKVAHKRNKARIGLDVDVKNTKAEHLYRHLGFKGSSTCLIDAHEYKHLQIAV